MGRPRKTAANDPMVARAVQLSAEGLSSAVIAVRLGTSRKNVDAWLRRAREEGEGAGDTPPEGFDEDRYRRVCRLLEEALQTMTEWGC